MLGVTTSHLVETVRQATGMTPGEMLHNRLVLEAKRMLVYSDYSAAEIALKLSFSSASHFGQWFRKMTDLTPREFRETFQNP
jgi:AraC-like DNA-binding protein